LKIHTLTALFLVNLVGCSGEADVARHTVEEYRADKTLRQEMFKKCANDPGTLGKTPDCINAQEAERLQGYGSLRNSAPIGLDSTKKH